MLTALVPFHGDEVETLYDEERKAAYFVPRHVCENMGMSWSSQYQSIANDEILGPEMIRVDINTNGKAFETVILPLKYFTGWLFKIQPNRVREDIKPKLLLYQRECYDVLHNYWLADTTTRTPTARALDNDLLILSNLITSMQENRDETREARMIAERADDAAGRANAGVQEHSYKLLDIDECESNLESRVARLEEERRRHPLAQENHATWMTMYKWAELYQPGLLFIWKDSERKKQQFRDMAKSFGRFDLRPTADGKRTYLYCPAEVFEQAHARCTPRWIMDDALNVRRSANILQAEGELLSD